MIAKIIAFSALFDEFVIKKTNIYIKTGDFELIMYHTIQKFVWQMTVKLLLRSGLWKRIDGVQVNLKE